MVLFSSEKQYFITSIKCFLKLDNDIKKKKNRKSVQKIQKLSEIWKIIIDQSINMGFNLNATNYVTDKKKGS